MKVAVILPYFGSFNNYFHIWLDSVKHNKGIDWLLFTDQAIKYEVPENCIIYHCQFEELKERFESKFHSRICLDKPYKLCDYKPYYGFLFSEYLGKYDFWGYCDCDLIFGDISHYITEDLLNRYDKLFRRGHFSLIRNSEEINTNFLLYNTYKTVIHSPVIYGYDESIKGYHLGFAGELMDKGYQFYDETKHIADVDFRHFPLYRIEDTTNPLMFVFSKGKLYELSYQHEELKKQEIMYAHFQKRSFETVTSNIDNDLYIIPNHIVSENTISTDFKDLWKQISTEKEGYYDIRAEKKDAVIRDIKRFMYEPNKIDSIRYRLFKHKK